MSYKIEISLKISKRIDKYSHEELVKIDRTISRVSLDNINSDIEELSETTVQSVRNDLRQRQSEAKRIAREAEGKLPDA